MHRGIARLVGTTALAAAVLTACGGTGTVTSSPGGAGLSASASARVDRTIAITYAGGKVTGVPSRVKLKHGSTVSLVVTSDVADEVHFHGYDLHADVAKGATITLTFTATLPGVYEVELEHLKRRLVVLQIQ